MRRDLIGYALLLAASLGYAFYVTLPQEKNRSDQVLWQKIDKGQISEIRSQTGDKLVSASKLPGVSNGFWIRQTAPTSKDGADESSDVSFKANDRFKGILTYLNPLYALRIIGDPNDESMVEFGIKDSNRSFQVLSSSGAVLNLLIGRRAYSTQNLYALDKVRNKIIMIDGQQITSFEKARNNLFERRLFEDEYGDVSGAKLVVGSKELTLDHSKRDGSGALKWSQPGEAGVIKPSYESWMNKLQRVKVVRYATADEQQAISRATPVFSVELLKLGTAIVRLNFRKSKDLKDPKKFDYWVLSSFLGKWAKVPGSRVNALEKDIPNILGN